MKKLKLLSVFLVVCILCCFCVPVSAFNELDSLMLEAEQLDKELEKIGKSAQLAHERYDNSTKPVDIAVEKYHTAKNNYEETLRMHRVTHDESHIGRADECNVCGKTVHLILDAKKEMDDAEQEYYRALEEVHKTGTALSREMHAAETCLGKIAEVNGKIANKLSERQFTSVAVELYCTYLMQTSLQKEKGAGEAKEKIKEHRTSFDRFKEYLYNNPELCGCAIGVAVGAGFLIPSAKVMSAQVMLMEAEIALDAAKIALKAAYSSSDPLFLALEALESAKEAYNAAVVYKARVMFELSCSRGFPILLGVLIAVGIILLFLLVCWIYVKYVNLPDKTFEEIQIINKDYEIVDGAYDEMIRIASSAELKNAYVKAKASGLRYRDELAKGYQNYKHGYETQARIDSRCAMEAVDDHVKIHPDETAMHKKAEDAYNKLLEFGRKHNPTFTRPLYGFMDLEVSK